MPSSDMPFLKGKKNRIPVNAVITVAILRSDDNSPGQNLTAAGVGNGVELQSSQVLGQAVQISLYFLLGNHPPIQRNPDKGWV